MNTELYNKALEIAPGLGINRADFGSDQAFYNKVVHCQTKKLWDEEFPQGETVEIDNNICECAEWTVGQSRCECGNVRISFASYGNLIEGITVFVEQV